jgi:ribosomal protein S18 acetylase RimI-like enzyme
MSAEITITLVETLTAEIEQGLSEMLVRVVDEGASIGFLPPLAYEEALAYWRGVLGPGVLLWIALEGGTIAGTIQLQLAGKANAQHRAEIAKLMVHPDYRRKGIAGLLMDVAEAAAEAEGRELLILDTREGDPSNLLYQSRGFLEAGRIPYFAQSGDGRLHTTVLYYKKR